MKTKTDRRVDRQRAKGRKGGREVERGKVRVRDRGLGERGMTKRTRERDRVLVEGPRIFGGRRLRVSMGTVSVRPLFRKTPPGERGEGVCPIPTHSRPPFSHSISFCHCSFSAPWWAHSPREILRGSLPRSAPFFSRSPFVVRRRFAVFLPRAVVYAKSRV